MLLTKKKPTDRAVFLLFITYAAGGKEGIQITPHPYAPFQENANEVQCMRSYVETVIQCILERWDIAYMIELGNTNMQ